MSAMSMKPVNVMAHLHLGCGESLSQLLPARPEVQKPAARKGEHDTQAQSGNSHPSKPRGEGGRQ